MSVTIYTKPGCPYCSAAKADFTARGIPFIELNAAADEDILEEMVELSAGRRVPVIVDDDGDVTVGFKGS